MQIEVIQLPTAGPLRIMPDLDVGIHHNLLPSQPRAGTKIYVLEIKEEFSVHAAQLSIRV